VTVKTGRFVVVVVPPWGWGRATQVHVAKPGLLKEVCSVQLSNRGRRTIYVARALGATFIGATVQPASDLAMPAWGGKVIVHGRSQRRSAS
jgi:hypothetical protein